MSINKIAKDKAFNNLDTLAIDDERFIEICDLENEDKELFYNILMRAQTNVLIRNTKNEEPFAISSIGKLKLKKNNKIALKYKNGIANEMGYSDFRQVPKDKLPELQKKANLLTIQEIKENNVNKIIKTKAKALRFKLK